MFFTTFYFCKLHYFVLTGIKNTLSKLDFTDIDWP